MQITVVMTVELPASGDIDAVEPLIVAAGQQAMGAAVQAACWEYERQVPACPGCASRSVQRQGTDTRQLQTSFGRVALQLRRLQCEACRRRFRPAEPFIAHLGGLNVTSRLREACALAGSSWPYQTAARVLRELCGAEISAEGVRQLTNAAGQLEAQTQAAAAVRRVTPTAASVRAERAAALAQPDQAGAPPPAQLLVGLDGGSHAASRATRRDGGQRGRGCHRADGGRPAWSPSVGATALRGHLRRCRATRAAEYCSGSDTGRRCGPPAGRAWRWRRVDQDAGGAIVPDATGILDWAHLERAVQKAIRAARPGAANKELRRHAPQTIPTVLWGGDVAGAVAALQALRPAESGPSPMLDETITYLQEQRAWIGDYDAWQAAGLPSGSGMVEREVALVIGRRMKRQGMRWRRDNATAIVALRTRTINQSWDAA